MMDLVVLVPGKDEKFVIDGLLSRHESLNTRQISYEIYVHPLHDPGVYHNASNFLRQFSNKYSYTLIFIDHEGSGQEQTKPNDIAKELKSDIERNGWPNRAEVIVFDPELEIWVWTESPHTAESLGWSNYLELKNWLVNKGLWDQNSPKPKMPKQALKMSLRKTSIPFSSSIYSEISQRVSLHKCQDQSFINLKNILRRWFPKVD